MVEYGISVNGEGHEEASSCLEAVAIVEEGHHLNKENNSLMAKEQGEQAVAIVQEGYDMNKESNSLMTKEPGEQAVAIVQEDHDMNKENNSLMANEQGEQAAAVVSDGHNMSKENNNLMANVVGTPPISSQLHDLSNRLQLLLSTPLPVEIPEKEFISVDGQDSLVQEYLRFLNTANKEELKKLKGIGEVRANLYTKAS